MEIKKTNRGFEIIEHPYYIETDSNQPQSGLPQRFIQQSSAISHEDSLDKAGSSYLWIGPYHHLNREEVSLLIKHLSHWLGTGSLDFRKKMAVDPDDYIYNLTEERLMKAISVDKTERLQISQKKIIHYLSSLACILHKQNILSVDNLTDLLQLHTDEATSLKEKTDPVNVERFCFKRNDEVIYLPDNTVCTFGYYSADPNYAVIFVPNVKKGMPVEIKHLGPTNKTKQKNPN